MVATIASPSVPGTNSPPKRGRPSCGARQDLEAPALADLVQLDDAGFRALFAGSPVKRLGHARFLRNVLIALGNSGDSQLAPLVEMRLAHEDPLVRGVAIWAFRRLAAEKDIARARDKYSPDETDPEVQEEWQGDLTPPLERQVEAVR